MYLKQWVAGPTGPGSISSALGDAAKAALLPVLFLNRLKFSESFQIFGATGSAFGAD